jgi:CBS domain-containing protein
MPEMPVREAMKSDIITASGDETMDKIARLMTQWKVAAVIITDGKKPIGLITEKDIIRELVAKDGSPSKIKAEDLMSSPVQTISADESISDALDKMMEYDVSRLPVTDSGDMVGIVSKPDLSEAKERSLDAYEPFEEGGTEEFPYGPAICEICGQHNTHLRLVNGRYVCDDCANIAEMDGF